MSDNIFSYSNGDYTVTENGATQEDTYQLMLSIPSATKTEVKLYAVVKKNGNPGIFGSYSMPTTGSQSVNEKKNEMTLIGEITGYFGGGFNIYEFSGSLTDGGNEIIKIDRGNMGFTKD